MEDFYVIGKCERCGGNIICDILPQEAIEEGVRPCCYCDCTVKEVNEKFPNYWRYK
jgi:hypothetical protein